MVCRGGILLKVMPLLVGISTLIRHCQRVLGTLFNFECLFAPKPPSVTELIVVNSLLEQQVEKKRKSSE